MLGFTCTAAVVNLWVAATAQRGGPGGCPLWQPPPRCEVRVFCSAPGHRRVLCCVLTLVSFSVTTGTAQEPCCAAPEHRRTLHRLGGVPVEVPSRPPLCRVWPCPAVFVLCVRVCVCGNNRAADPRRRRPEAQELTLSRVCLIDTSDKDYYTRFLWNFSRINLDYNFT